MPGARTRHFLFGVLPVMAALAGCASAPAIPPDELKNYAAVIPKETIASAVTEVDGKRNMSLSGSVVNVTPGSHKIEITTCQSGSTSGCVPRIYPITLAAGKAYLVRSADLIEVYDRFSLNAPRIDRLQREAGKFLTDEEFAALQMQQQMTARAQQTALLEQRRLNTPKVRKIGAKICQRNGEVVKLGYVEGMTDEKVQIRISEAFLAANRSYSPSNFVPTIVWDSPMNWDLCE
jgi:hypothetical protein